MPHVCCSQPQEVCWAPRPPTRALLVATFWVMAPLAPGPQQGTSLPPSTLSQSHAGSPCCGGPCFLTPCTSGFPSLLCSWAPNAAVHSPAVTHGTAAGARPHAMEMCRDCLGCATASLGWARSRELQGRRRNVTVTKLFGLVCFHLFVHPRYTGARGSHLKPSSKQRSAFGLVGADRDCVRGDV